MKNHLILFVIPIIVSFYLISCEKSESHPVKPVDLDNENFKEFIEENDFVLVKFYAPKCGACIAMAEEYEKLAEIVAKEDDTIKIAQVDAIAETKLAKEYDITGYPTIRFFRKGLEPLDYIGIRDADKIIPWLIKKTGPPAVTLRTVTEARNLIKENEVVTIGFFEKESDKKVSTFLTAAELSEYSVFAIATKKAILEHFQAGAGDILLFNKEYEKEATFDQKFTYREIVKFVELRSLPLIMEFTSENLVHIFGGTIKTHLLLFLSKSSPNTPTILEDVETVAKDFKHDILFTTIDTDNSEHNAILNYLGLPENQTTPTVRLLTFAPKLDRYMPKKPKINSDNIRKFIRDYYAGKLKKVLKSEKLGEDWNKGPVYELVGDNFEDVVKDPTKKVLVFFYTPWCSICQKFTAVYDSIGEYYKKDGDVIIAKIDASSNEVDTQTIEGVPTITLYIENDEVLINYKGKRTLEDIVRFVESEGRYQDGEEEDPVEDSNETDDPTHEEL